MTELINNFQLSNKVFALVLKEDNLVEKDEMLLEVSSPLSVAILFNLRGYHTYISTDIDDRLYNNIRFNRAEKHNFIYNGELCEEVKSAVRKLAPVSSFNIGICSNNEKEFALLRDNYTRFKGELEATFGIEINEVDKTLDDYKAYVLSYKRK